MPKNYWLMKSESEVYSIDDLKHDGKTFWDGVRNYQARNFMRDTMKKGDEVFFYHSNSDPTGIAGIAAVVKEGYPDATAFDPKDHHFDPKSKKDSPAWYGVDIQFKKKFKQVITLEALKKNQALKDMPLLQRGQRLSVQPVTAKQWDIISELGQ